MNIGFIGIALMILVLVIKRSEVIRENAKTRDWIKRYTLTEEELIIQEELRKESIINSIDNKDLKIWVEHLEIFYFYKPSGGHGDDHGVEFRTPIRYENLEDLTAKLFRLRITLKKIPPNWPKRVKGKRYSHEEYKKFKSEIHNFPDYEQPGHCTIFKHDCFVWVHKNYFTIIVSTRKKDGYFMPTWHLSNSDYENCKSLDVHLKEIGFKKFVYREIESDERYISKKIYAKYLH